MFGADYVHISRLRKSGLFATVTQHFSVSTAASHTHICTFTTVFTHMHIHYNAVARLDAYAKQDVPRRTGAAGGSSAGGGSSGRS